MNTNMKDNSNMSTYVGVCNGKDRLLLITDHIRTWKDPIYYIGCQL